MALAPVGPYHGAARALQLLGISLEQARLKVEETVGPAGTSPTAARPFRSRAKKAPARRASVVYCSACGRSLSASLDPG